MPAPQFQYGGPKVDRVFEVFDKANPRRGRCRALGCTKPAQKHRTQSKKWGKPVFNAYCARCESWKRKARDPEGYALNKRRGIPMMITLDQWRWFVRHHNLLEQRGRTANALTVDRKRSWMCYCALTIQPMTCSENSRKQ